MAVAVAVVALVAAGAPAATPAPAPAAAAEGFPVSVENCGRTLTFDAPPSRAVTGFHPVLETLLELGLDEGQIIGRLRHDETQGFLPGHKAIYDRIPQISEVTGELPPKEELLAVGGDLVVTLGYFDFDPAFGYATVEELGAAGTQVFIMGDRCSPEEEATYEVADLFDDFRDLGKIFGVPDRAEEVIADLEGVLADVEERVDGLDPVRVACATPTPEAFSVLGVGLCNEISRRAGGVNAFAEAGSFVQVNLEEVATADVQAFLTFQHSDGQSAEQRRALVEAAAPTSEAVREGRVLDVPISALSPGPRQVHLVADVARLIHPEVFAD